MACPLKYVRNEESILKDNSFLFGSTPALYYYLLSRENEYSICSIFGGTPFMYYQPYNIF